MSQPDGCIERIFEVSRREIRVEFSSGRGVALIAAKFNPRRWRGNVGIGHLGDGKRQKRWRCYQWPFGLISLYGRWT